MAKLVFALGLFALIVWFVDVQRSVELLAQTEPVWIVAAIFVVQVQVLLSAVRWRVTLLRLGQVISFRHAAFEYYLASFANMTLPGGITGDAARAYRNRQGAGLDVAIHGVVLDRLSGQMALFVVTVVGWLSWPVLMQGSVPEFGLRVLISTLLTIAFGAAIVYLLIRLAPDFMIRFIVAFGPALSNAWCADRQWIVQGVLSVSIVLTYLLVFWLSSQAIQQPMPVAAVITLVPVVLLSMLIPLSIGGWGLREAAAATLWPLAGLTSEAGVATSIVYALVSLIGCLPGLLAMLAQRIHRHFTSA